MIFIYDRIKPYIKNTEIGKLSGIGTKYQNGKAFLHDVLGLTSCEIFVNEMPKGVKLPFSHKHKQNEEIYIFIKGSGKMTIDGETIDVKEGSCVKVLPGASRTMESKEDMQCTGKSRFLGTVCNV